jgi:type II secretory pathway pseudopilin PulG
MKTWSLENRVGAASSRGGFTLVEILAAMTLAVLVMLGVAQVFKISSEAVTEAESLSSGYQYGRALMTTLERDLRCFASEGYLAIIGPNAVDSAGEGVLVNQQFGSSTPTNPLKVRYPFDTLMFTTVGRYEDVESGTPTSLPMGTAAEVVYTLAARKDPGTTLSPYQTITTGNADPRTMMLVRRVYPVNATTANMSSGTTQPATWRTAGMAVTTSPKDSKYSCLAILSTDRWNDRTLGFRLRWPAVVPDVPGSSTPQPQVDTTVTWTDGFPTYPDSVNMVVCERISQFYVEVLIGDTWRHVESATNRFVASWSGHQRLAATTDATLKGTCMPELIRVTAVVHPENDQKPLNLQPYAGNIPDNYPKFYRGMVFRQVFGLNGQTNN